MLCIKNLATNMPPSFRNLPS